MRRGSRFVAALIVLAAVSDRSDADDRLTAEQVAAAIEQLGSDRLSERRQAEIRLLDAGPDVLAAIPAPEEFDDAARQQAVRRIRQELERRLARESGRPRLVTFRGRGTVVELLQEIEQQTTNRVPIDAAAMDSRTLPLEVHWEQTPFWAALIEIAARAGLEIQEAAEGGSIALSPRGVSVPGGTLILIDAATPFLVRGRVTNRDGEADPRGDRLLRLRVEVLAEPRLRPVFLSFRESELGLSVNGASLEPLNPLAVRDVEFTDAGAAVLDLAYQRGGRADSSALTLDGRLEVELVGLERDLRFTELSAALPRVERRGNVSVSLEQIASNAAAGTADVQLTLRYAAGGPTFESHRVGSLLADAVLVLPNGERRRNADAPALMREQDGTIGASYHFTNLPTDWRAGSLEYTVPAAMLRVPVSVAAMAPVQK